MTPYFESAKSSVKLPTTNHSSPTVNQKGLSLSYVLKYHHTLSKIHHILAILQLLYAITQGLEQRLVHLGTLSNSYINIQNRESQTAT